AWHRAEDAPAGAVDGVTRLVDLTPTPLPRGEGLAERSHKQGPVVHMVQWWQRREAHTEAPGR
ncbi:MAG: hypothetical protein ACRDID_10365, partial [Ktedonobacterales bacterium]